MWPAHRSGVPYAYEKYKLGSVFDSIQNSVLGVTTLIINYCLTSLWHTVVPELTAYGSAESSTFQPSVFSVGEVQYESESDSNIEHDLTRPLLDDGKQRNEAGDLAGAENVLQICSENPRPTPDQVFLRHF